MANYQASSTHKIFVRNTDTGMVAEKECDAAWWVNTPSWAQFYIFEGMRRELEELEQIQAAAENDEVKEGS